MLQTIDGIPVYVVDIQEMPELPITAHNLEEAPYALALEAAIRDGIITDPGKYGIRLEGTNYIVYLVQEPGPNMTFINNYEKQLVNAAKQRRKHT